MAGGAAAVHPPALIKAAAPEGKTAGGEEGGEVEMPEATRKAFTEAMEVADVENGLSEGVVESQRTKHGFNESIEKQTPLWLLFLQKFKGPVPYMIIIAMAVAYGLQKWSAQTNALSCATPSRYANRLLKCLSLLCSVSRRPLCFCSCFSFACRVDGTVIGVLLLVNGVLAFHEDLRARKAMRELMQSLQVMTRVKRSGSAHTPQQASVRSIGTVLLAPPMRRARAAEYGFRHSQLDAL
jgi:magnesium-transporting ATPase (P-type)